MRGRRLALAVAVMCAALALPAPLWAQDDAAPAPAGGETSASAPDEAPAEPSPVPGIPSPPPAPDPAPSPAGDGDTAPAPPQPAPEPVPAEAPAPAAPVLARQGGVTVSMIDFAFQPASVQVPVGGSVIWVNDGPDEPHTATADDGSFDTGELGVGGSATVSFDSAGTFPYLCTLHPAMTGTVTVLAEDTGTAAREDTGDETADPGTTGVPGPTEADAVASPDAAGTATTLPATGDETGLLAAAGIALLLCGLQLLAVQRLARLCAER